METTSPRQQPSALTRIAKPNDVLASLSSHIPTLSCLQNPLQWSPVTQLQASAAGLRAVFITDR